MCGASLCVSLARWRPAYRTSSKPSSRERPSSPIARRAADNNSHHIIKRQLPPLQTNPKLLPSSVLLRDAVLPTLLNHTKHHELPLIQPRTHARTATLYVPCCDKDLEIQTTIDMTPNNASHRLPAKALDHHQQRLERPHHRTPSIMPAIVSRPQSTMSPLPRAHPLAWWKEELLRGILHPPRSDATTPNHARYLGCIDAMR